MAAIGEQSASSSDNRPVEPGPRGASWIQGGWVRLEAEPVALPRRWPAVWLALLFAVAVAGWSGTAAAQSKDGGSGNPPAANQSQDDTPPVKAYKRLLQSTVYLEYLEDTPDGRMRSRGTGWIIDKDRRLVVTNRHVVGDQAQVSAWYPVFKDGEVVGDPRHYFENVRSIRGKVVDRDSRRDLAIVQLDRLPDELTPLPLAPKSPMPGEKLFSLGGWPEGSEGWWIFTAGEVRQVYDRSTAMGQVCKVVETQLPTNRGNSGGPVVNDRGELVAVVEGHSTDARLVSLFIAVEEVRKYMEEVDPLVDPDTAEEFYTRGDRNFFEGQYRTASQDYSACLKLDPNYIPAITSRAWCQFYLRDFQTAMSDFDAAIRKDDDCVEAWRGKARCLMGMGQFTEARDVWNDAIRRDSSNGDAYFYRGDCNYQLRQDAQALSDLNQAVNLQPGDIADLNLRAMIHRRMGNYAAALADGKAAINYDSDDWRGFHQAGLALRALGKTGEAADFLARSLQLNENNWEGWLNLGNCFKETGKDDQAIEAYAKSIDQNGNNPYSYWGLGLIARDRQQWTNAINLFTRCIELDPNDPDYYDQRANCYDQIGNSSGAANDRSTAARLR